MGFDKEAFFAQALPRAVRIEGLPDGWQPLYAKQFSVLEYAAMNVLPDELRADFESMLSFVILGVCDEDGGSVFEEEDRERLKGLGFDHVKTMAEAIMRLNGLDRESEADDAGKSDVPSS